MRVQETVSPEDVVEAFDAAGEALSRLCEILGAGLVTVKRCANPPALTLTLVEEEREGEFTIHEWRVSRGADLLAFLVKRPCRCCRCEQRREKAARHKRVLAALAKGSA